MKVVLFCRVSTLQQEYDRQVNELSALALSNGWSVDGVFAEKISGAKKNFERAELMKMVQFVEASSILVVYLFNSSSQSAIEGDDALYLIEAVLGNGLLCTE